MRKEEEEEELCCSLFGLASVAQEFTQFCKEKQILNKEISKQFCNSNYPNLSFLLNYKKERKKLLRVCRIP